MRYLMMIILPEGTEYENGVLPSAELVAAMTKYNEELAKAGVLLSLDGLHPTSKGARIQSVNGTHIVTDGPYAETKEVFGGFWMIKVNSKEEAIDWAKRVPEHGVTVELRQVFDIEDFPADILEAGDSAIVRDHLEKVGQAQ